MLRSGINYFDIFGTTFNFSSFGHRKFHTALGLFLSLGCYSIILTLIGVFGRDMFNRANPIIISEETRPLEYFKTLPDQKQFTFAWRIRGILLEYFIHTLSI